MPHRFPPAASAPPSRRAATPLGIRPVPRTFSKVPTAPPWSFPPLSSAGPAKRSTRKRRCCVRWKRCPTKRCASCACSATTRRARSSPRLARSRNTSSSTRISITRGRISSTPAAPYSALRRPRARRWRISISATFRSALSPAWPTAKRSCSSSACRSRRGTTKWPPANMRLHRSLKTPIWPPTIKCSSWR